MNSSNRLNLARKYRPQGLQEVIGQPTAVKILEEALKSDRIAPAYLFSGPRGTGKTTCARLMAKAASCLKREKNGRPCGGCRSCVSIRAQKSMDLIEIDGASHTGVDEVRSIIDSIAYKPSYGARLIYIIDEVHMLSNAAFNALLKSLEEPPPHALFLFATTEIEKIPDTILSRVQRIEMCRIAEQEIIINLDFICAKEKIKASKEVLEQIAASADGSLRDAQTLLEQIVLLSGSTKISSEVVDSFLGTIGRDQEIQILESLAAKNLEDLLEKTDLHFQRGKDLVRLLSRLVMWSRALLIVKSSGSKAFTKKEFPNEQIDKLLLAFKAWSIEDLDRLFEILWTGYERIRKSEFPKITLETTLIRASRLTLTEDLATILKYLQSSGGAITPTVSTSVQNPAPYSQRPSTTSSRAAPKAPVKPKISETAKTTDELLKAIKKHRPQLYALISCCDSSDWKKSSFELSFPRGHFAFKQLSEKILHKELEQLLSEITSGKCNQLIMKESGTKKNIPAAPKKNFMSEAKNEMVNDPAVKRAAELLKGKIESVTIEGVTNPTSD